MYYYVYVLYSIKDKMLYTGYTKDLNKRIKTHNEGEVVATKYRRPLILIYWEGCLNQQDATKRELENGRKAVIFVSLFSLHHDTRHYLEWDTC